MKRALLVVVAVLGTGLALHTPASAEAAGPTAVTRWIDLELETIAARSVNPPRASRALAHLSSAMYLAALAGGSAPDDAVAGAASRVLSQADAFIACWDAKYAYWSLRPVTAIRRLVDPSWLSYIVTPPFPSYVSGHSSTSAAASTVLAAFFPANAAQLRAMAEEAAVSRLYGGIHYRSDNEAGLTLGRRVGGVALHAYHVG